uniref:Salivary yellow-related protein n=1 Tax=Sergentomyia schwetzi TaxID=114605 RepID=A0A6B9VL73_9DIPT|nr:salivary yellow-related protein [Sergentomyia schwetzi]
MNFFLWLFVCFSCILQEFNEASAIQDRVKIVYNWTVVEYAGKPEADYQSASIVPMGFAHYVDDKKVFIAIPRKEPGILETLTEIDDDMKNKSPRIKPFSGKPTVPLVSIYQPVIDDCKRLWVLDAGSAEYTGHDAPTAQRPAIIAFDLTNAEYKEIIRHEFTSSEPLGFGGFAVDVVDPKNCNEVFVYMTNFKENSLYIYDHTKENSWTINLKSFQPDKETVLENFTYEVGIFGIALGKRNAQLNRSAYYISGSSTVFWSIETNLLRVKAPRNVYTPKKIGDRGDDTDAIALAYDPDTEVIFFAEVKKRRITCWKTSTPFNTDNMGVVYESDNLKFVTDISVDSAGDLWFLSNADPPTGTKNPDDDILLLKVKASDAIQGTKCENKA